MTYSAEHGPESGRPQNFDDILTFIEPLKLRTAQCPKCSKFARIIASGQDNSPDSCDYWYTTDCKICGIQQA